MSKISVVNRQSSVKYFLVGIMGFALFLIAYQFLLITPIEAATNNVTTQIGIQQPNTNAGVQAGNNSADTLLGGVTRNAITLVFTIASISAVIMFLWGSVNWILSGGDKEKIAAARKKITAALIGLVVLALSFLILSLVGVFIGINPLKGLQIPGLGAGLSPANNIKNAGGGNVQ